MKYRTRRHGKRHQKRRVFGKKAVRAIKAIAQRPVETKWSIWSNSVFNAAYSPSQFGSSYNTAAHINIFDTVYRADSVATRSRSEVMGQEFQLRGISVKWMLWTAVTHPIRYRLSLISFDTYFSTGAGFNTLSTAAEFFEDEDNGNLLATFQRFNTDKVRVVWSRQLKAQPNGATATLVEGKGWIPIRRKCVVAEAEPTSGTSSTVSKLKDHQYYLILECLDPGLLSTTTGNYNWVVDFKVYWKDA